MKRCSLKCLNSECIMQRAADEYARACELHPFFPPLLGDIERARRKAACAMAVCDEWLLARPSASLTEAFGE